MLIIVFPSYVSNLAIVRTQNFTTIFVASFVINFVTKFRKYFSRFYICADNGSAYSDSSWSPSPKDQSVTRRYLFPEASIDWNSFQRKYYWSYWIWEWILFSKFLFFGNSKYFKNLTKFSGNPFSSYHHFRTIYFRAIDIFGRSLLSRLK